MPTLPSGSANPISFRDIWQNIHNKSGDETPALSLQPVTNLQDLSISMASASVVLEDRESIHDARYAIRELWGSNYPSSIISNVLVKRGSSVETSFVDGETATITFDTTATNNHTVTLRNSSNTVLDTNTVTISGGSGTTNFSSLALAEAAGYYARVTRDTFNNVNSSAFTHYDALTGLDIGRNPASIQYIDNSSATTDIAMSFSTTGGTATSQAWTFGDATITDGDSNARTPTTSTSATQTVTYTGTGVYPVDLTVYGNPSTGRNSDAATQESVDIRYSKDIPVLISSSTGINYGDSVTLYATSEGFNGNLYFGYDDNLTASDMDFVGSTTAVAVNTVYVQDTNDAAFTISSTGTKYLKAFHAGDSNAVVGGTSIDVQPTFTYTAASKTITAAVSTNTATFTATSISGNSNIGITIGPTSLTTPAQSPASTTNYSTGLTLSPGIYNGTYNVPFTGSADYSQTHSPIPTLTVNPTVGIAVHAPSSGTFYSTSDYNSQSVTAATHGPASTTFTIDPTVVGSTINKYTWSPSTPLTWTYSGGTGASTQGAISGSFSDGGLKNWQLSVYETSGGGGTNATSGVLEATVVQPRKYFDNQPIIGTQGVILRRYSSYDIDFQCDYIKNVKLQRKLSGTWTDLVGTTATGIANDFVDEDVDPSFTIPSAADLDTTSREMRLVDTDYTSLISLEMKNANASPSDSFKIYDRLAGTPTSVSEASGNQAVTVSWTDGDSNAGGNKIYVYSDAGTTQVTSSPFGPQHPVNSYVYSYSLTGTSRVPFYFKVSGVNLSSEEGSLSDVTSAAYAHPGINIGYHTGGDTVSAASSASKNFYFTALHGYNFSGAITSVPDIGSATSITATSTAANMAYGTANGVYTIKFNATADISQTATEQTETLTVNPVADFTISDSTLFISPPAGSGLSADGLSINDASTGSNIDTYAYSVSRDGTNLGTFNPTFSNADNPIASSTITSWGVGTYDVVLTVSGNSTSDIENKNNAFTISNYAAQTLVLSGEFLSYPDSTLRRGSTYTVTGAIGATPITNVKLMHEFRDDRGTPAWGTSETTVATDIFGSNESDGTFTYDFTLPTNLALTLAGGSTAKWRIKIMDNSDDDPISYGGAMNILDGLPVIPTIGSATVPSPSNGTANAVWTAGNFSNSFKVRLFKEDGTDLGESYTDSASPYTYSIGTALKVRRFTVSAFNIGGEESGQSSLSNAVTIYPDLTTSRNVISPTSATIYSTSNYQANSLTFNAPTSATSGDNLSYSYTEVLDFAGVSLSNANTSTATVNAGSGVGGVSIKLTVSNAGSDSSETTCALGVDYYPKFTQSNGNPGLVITTGTSNINPASAIGASIYWQGFAMVGDITDTWRFFYTDSSGGNQSDSNDNVYPTSPGLGGTRSQAGQDLSVIALTGPSAGGNYRLYVQRANDTSLSTYVTFSVITTHSGYIYYEDTFFTNPSAYQTALDAAQDLPDTSYRDTVWWSSATGGSGYPVTNVELWDSQAAIGGSSSGRYDPYEWHGSTDGWYKSGLNVIQIEDQQNGFAVGEVKTTISEVPGNLTCVLQSKDHESITVRVAGDFRVTKYFDLEYYRLNTDPWGNGPQPTVSSRVESGTQDITIGSLLESTNYHIRVRGRNDLHDGSYTSASFNVTTDAAPTPAISFQWSNKNEMGPGYLYFDVQKITITNRGSHSVQIKVNSTTRSPQERNGTSDPSSGGYYTPNTSFTNMSTQADVIWMDIRHYVIWQNISWLYTTWSIKVGPTTETFTTRTKYDDIGK